MTSPRLPRAVPAAFLLLSSLVFASPVAAATVPSGFTDSPVASGMPSPTAMAFAPDGRLFVAQQGGALRVIKNGSLLPDPFLTVTVNSTGERGLLGVAFDPNFASNHFVYVYYTATAPAIHNRISRFTANGDVAAAGSEVVIFELPNLSSASNHNGGAIHFGPDGKLYVAVGENSVPTNSQSLSTVLGKILRLNADGSIPSDNPFFNTASGINRAIWALGLRNPFTFAFQPGTGRMFINDVGAGKAEEINEGIVGSNYGWPNSEGPTSTPGERSPVFAYAHSTGPECAITGGAFYNPPSAQFPVQYVGKYFFADFCAGWIHWIDPALGEPIAQPFATGASLPVDLQVGPDGSLYYLARGGGGVVRRIHHTGDPLPPTTYVPITPTRFLDTRIGKGVTGQFVSNQPRSWQVAGQAGVPADAVAVTANVTVVEPTGAGWLTVSPEQTLEASPSTINFPARDIRANNLTIALGPDGKLWAVLKSAPGRTTQLLFDVTGYFVASDAGATYRAVAPDRSLDTRDGTGLSGRFMNAEPRSWQVAGRNGIPKGAVAVTGNVTVTAASGPGYLAVTPDGAVNPPTSNLNFPAGDDRANGLTVALDPDGRLNAVFRGGAGQGTHVIFDVTGYYLDDLGGAKFVPVIPGRVLDTRAGIGLSGKFLSHGARGFTIAPNGGVAADAVAVTGNLTIVNQTRGGYVSLTDAPTGTPQTSTLNFPARDTRANGVTAPLGPGGSVGLIYMGGGGTTDLILDITGYFR